MNIETAAEFGCLESCFRHHRADRFSFNGAASSLSDILSRPKGTQQDEDGVDLLLRSPDQSFHDETLDEVNSQGIFLWDSYDITVPSLPLLGELQAFKDILIQTHEIDLGSDPAVDLENYLELVISRRCVDVSAQWLPLCPVKTEKDEGLQFPSYTAKLPSLLIREIEREGIDVEPTHTLLQDDRKIADSILLHAPLSVPLRRPKCWGESSGPITPPLSPVSDYASPFVPDVEATVVDLVSEAPSPIGATEGDVQHLAYSERLCPDMPDDLSDEQLHLRDIPDNLLSCTYNSTEKLKVEVTIAPASSEVPEDIDIAACHRVPKENDAYIVDFELEEYFEDAFQALLADRHALTTRQVSQEQLNPADSFTRVSVPLRDFSIENPEWNHVCSDARTHFSWLLEHGKANFALPKEPRDTRSDYSLRWTPVSNTSDKICLNESISTNQEAESRYITTASPPSLNSSKYIPPPSTLVILEVSDDDELEEWEDLTKEGSVLLKKREQDGETEGAAVMSRSTEVLDWPQIKQTSQNLGKDDENSCILPSIDGSGSMSKLLSSFMDLRAAKRPKHSHEGYHRQAAHENIQAQASRKPSTTPVTAPANLAVTPHIDIPYDKWPIFVSLGIPRQLLWSLQKHWGADNLIDKDYSLLDGPSRYGQWPEDKASIYPPVVEADVSLTPTAGAIVTSLLKVKQRALPGSSVQPPLRNRVSTVSDKYESLFILVSECNVDGEFAGSLTASDKMGLEDFKRFTAVLKTDVRVQLVEGGNETLAKWLLQVICSFATDSKAIKQSLSHEDTP